MSIFTRQFMMIVGCSLEVIFNMDIASHESEYSLLLNPL